MKKPYDITFIEIKKTDNINSESYLEIDDYIFDENSIKNYRQKSIYLIHYPNINVELSTGVIQAISEDNINIMHFCETHHGSSGSPIINLNNHKVLGIHKGAGEHNYNIGTFLKIPIQNLKQIIKKKNELNNKNNEKKNIPHFGNINSIDIPILSKDNMKVITQQMENVCVKLK